MYFIVDSDKTFDSARKDLESAIQEFEFGILHIHDLADTLLSKGFDFNEECQVFEICNPRKAAEIMSVDMKLNMYLPCRISIYTEAGNTKIGFIRPTEMLAPLLLNSKLSDLVHAVEEKLMLMAEKAK